MVNLQWNGDAFMRHCNQAMQVAMLSGAEAFANEMRREIATAAPPHSLPGEPPHKIIGDLLASIVVATAPGASGGSGAGGGASTIIVRAGSSSEHAIFLEPGTRKMAPRPFIVSTLLHSQSIVVAAMGGAVP